VNPLKYGDCTVMPGSYGHHHFLIMFVKMLMYKHNTFLFFRRSGKF